VSASSRSKLSQSREIRVVRPLATKTGILTETLRLPEVQRKIAALCVFVFAFLLYSNTLLHDYTVDDPLVYTDNTLVQQGLGGIWKLAATGFFYGGLDGNNDSQYRPVSLMLFALEKQLVGNNPHINHYVNVLFYSLACLLLFFFL
jgi:protein O-mannosyl-transferase